jgi:hypothetical protein
MTVPMRCEVQKIGKSVISIRKDNEFYLFVYLHHNKSPQDSARISSIFNYDDGQMIFIVPSDLVFFTILYQQIPEFVTLPKHIIAKNIYQLLEEEIQSIPTNASDVAVSKI